MGETVEERRRHHLVAGQDLRPVLHGLVRREDHAPALVAVGDEPEEEARLGAAHGLEAHLVDHKKGDVHVLAPPKALRPDLGVARGVTLGETYPAPIVDHADARDEALAAYETIK